MAIALDSSGLWDEDNSSLVGTSVAVGSGLSESILVVCIAEHEGGGDETVSAVTSDQDGAFTQLGSNVNLNNANASIHYLLSPTVATHAISLTTPNSTQRPISGIWSLWTGVNQATPFGSGNTAMGTSTTPSVTVTTESGEVVIDSLCTAPTSIVTNGADQTTVQTNFTSDGTNNVRGHVSQQAGASGGVMSYSLSLSRDWALISAPLQPGGGDVTAPVLSSPSGTATGQTTADLSVSTDEGNGTLYWVVTTSAVAPSVAQIQAGQDNSGTAAAASGNQAVSATGTQNAGATGLTADTTYTAHFQHQDAATNDSTVVSSATFTTDAAGTAIRTGHFTSRHVG